MKEKCHALRVAIAITIASLLISFLLWSPLPSPFSKCVVSFLQMFFGGILGSSFVTLFVYATEYKVQKRIALENIWSEARRINSKFAKIQYLYLHISSEIVAGYFNEEWRNQNRPDFGKKQEHSYRAKWVKELSKEYPDIKEQVSGVEFENILINIIKKQADKYLDSLNSAIDDYISIAETDWNKYDNLFGAVEFLTGKSHYVKLYQNLYEPFKQKLRLIQEQVYPHFSSYKAGENENRGVVLTKAVELQRQFFTIESNENSTNIYNDFYSEMERKLEDFRVSIYGDTATEYPDRLIVLNILNSPLSE